MKKTILQRFFLSLCLMIVGCLWGSVAWAETVTYQHVFNEKPSTGKNVTLSGVAWNISATNLKGYNSGNYAGVQFGAKGVNGQITLTSPSNWNYNGKTKITEVRLWLNLGGTSVTPTVTIGGKAATSDGTKVVKNSSAGTDWTKTSKVTFTPAADGNTGVIEIDVTSVKAGYICALEIDCEEAGPTLVVSSNSITFGNVVKESSKEQSLTISGTSLTANADLTITGTDAAMFSVSTTTITATDGNIAPKDVTVTYTPTVTGDHSATLNISSGNLIKKVTLTGTGFVPHYISATTYYKKITSIDELVDGGVYLIVCESKDEAMGVIDDKRCLGAAITLNGNTYTGSVNQSSYPYEVTITKDKSGYYNLYHAGGMYITSTSTDFAFAAKGDNGWSISFDNSGNALISNKNHQNKADYYIQRNNKYNYYKNYQSGQAPIQLYQKVGEMPIAKATGYVSTYVADFAYVMPKHITGHTVTLAAQQGVISTEKVFRADDEVPALTPLLIKSDEDYAAEENSRNYHPAVLNKTVKAYKDDNMLEYRRTAANLTNTMKNESVYYYKLAIKEGKVGFYWGADNGAAFKMTKPSTAYLTVPQSMSVQGFVLNLEEGETTGIATVVTNEDAPIYNLQGIRMNGKNLPKGIYIQGGKKFMVK